MKGTYEYPVSVYLRLRSGSTSPPRSNPPLAGQALDFICLALDSHHCLDELAVLCRALQPVRVSVSIAEYSSFLSDKPEVFRTLLEWTWEQVPKASPARLDSDGTAKPLTRLVTRVDPNRCIPYGGIGAMATAYEDAKGERVPLQGKPLTRCGYCGWNNCQCGQPGAKG